MATLYDVKIGRSLFFSVGYCNCNEGAFKCHAIEKGLWRPRQRAAIEGIPRRGALPMSYRDTVRACVYGINRVISLLIHYYIIFALIMSRDSVGD